jgi:hypothetical protein
VLVEKLKDAVIWVAGLVKNDSIFFLDRARQCSIVLSNLFVLECQQIVNLFPLLASNWWFSYRVPIIGG